MVAMYSEHIEAGETIDQQMYMAVCRNLGDYFDRVFFDRWEKEVQQMLLALCPYSEFTLPMAEMLVGSNDTYRNLRYCYHVGSFLIKKDDHTWAFREYFPEFLKWKQRALWTEEMLLENYRRAALYFETTGDFENALLYYRKAGMNEQIKNLLIQNARKHPGKGNYYQLRKYYLELPEDIIQENPVLMCGMSMLHSIMFHPEESERWYQKLQEYGNSPYRSADERKEVKTRLAYLDIGLPHRAAKGLVGILRKSAKLSSNREIDLPEFSITGNMPSLMNGGLDYCDWSLIDDKLARFMAAPLEIILKKASKGLVNIALAESGFERASMDNYELMTRLNNGYQSADGAPNIEMCFAAMGVLVKCHLINGQLPTAKGLLESFRNKVEKEKAVQLYDNLYAFETWLSLYSGDGSRADAYLLSAPDYMYCDTQEIPKLTQQEQRILAMLCVGKNTEEICKECGITYSGLKFHNRNIYQKLGVTSRAGAERAAVRLGIVHRG